MSAGRGAGQRRRKASEAGAHEGVRIKTEVRSTRKFGAHVSSEHTTVRDTRQFGAHVSSEHTTVRDTRRGAASRRGGREQFGTGEVGAFQEVRIARERSQARWVESAGVGARVSLTQRPDLA